MEKIPLLDKMKRQLLLRKGKWRSVAVDADVSYDWLTSVMIGRIKDPGSQRVERVLAALEKKRPARC